MKRQHADISNIIPSSRLQHYSSFLYLDRLITSLKLDTLIIIFQNYSTVFQSPLASVSEILLSGERIANPIGMRA